MEKENGEGGGQTDSSGKGGGDSSLLDAASLFGAYWGRDANSLLGAGGGFHGGGGGFGLLGQGGGGGGGQQRGGYPPTSTLSVAASQAASLGIHPAASAAWWSMASHLAAQDYLARLQASGLGGFPGDPYGAGAMGAGAMGALAPPAGPGRAPAARGRPQQRQHKEKQQNMRSSYGLPKTSSPSMSASSMQMSSLGLTSMAGSHSRAPTHLTASPQPQPTKHSRKSSSSAAAKASALSGAYLAQAAGGKGALKEKELAMLRGDLLMAQAAMAQNAYQAAVAQKNSSSLFANNPFGIGSSGASSDKDRHPGLDSIANLPHTILSAALEGSDSSSILGGVRLPPDTEIIKYTSSIVGPKVPGTTNRGRKKTISLDPPHVSVLPALSSTGLLVERNKRAKLDADYAGLPQAHQGAVAAAANSGLSKELLQSIANQSGLNLAALEKQFAEQFGSSSAYRSFGSSSNYASTSPAQDVGLNLSSKPAQSSGSSEREKHREESPAGPANDEDAPLNLSLKPTSTRSDKEWKSSVRGSDEAANSLSSLSNITASLGQGPPPITERVSRRKPGAKPRRVIQDTIIQPSASPQRNTSVSPVTGLSHLLGPTASESPGPKSSGSEDNDMGPWHTGKEGRPRNLGRGVSKPKKNTVASLLAQSRALGIRPALKHQFLQEAADLLNPELQEKLKAAMGDASGMLELSGSESEQPSDSCPSDSDTSDVRGRQHRRRPDEAHLRLPIAMGWKRETMMRGLSRSGGIKGDVVYYPPEPHGALKLKNMQDLSSYLEKNPSPALGRDNFSFSSRVLIGSFLQAGDGDCLRMSEGEVAKRLEEARRALGGAGSAALAVEQRIELARQQQAAREARKDQAKGREQARLAREQERSEKAEQARRDKEARSQQLLEQARSRHNKKVLDAADKSTVGFWKSIEAIACSSTPGRQVSVSMPSMSLTLTPVPAVTISPIAHSGNSWMKDDYNALDKIVNFAENAALDFAPTKAIVDVKKDFKLTPVKTEAVFNPKNRSNAVSVIRLNKAVDPKKSPQTVNKIMESYSRMNEFVSGDCDWVKLTVNQKRRQKSIDIKDLEAKYLKAKNAYMSSNLMLMPNLAEANETKEDVEKKVSDVESVEIIDLDAEEPAVPARRKRQEELEKQRQEDQSRKQQERELKRQQAVMLKEQMFMAEVGKQRELMFTVELERERRRQHMSLVKQLDGRRRYEERERRKHRLLLDKLVLKERRMEQRRKELDLLGELRKPQEDSTLSDQKSLPVYNRIPGLKLCGQAMADMLMLFEFIHNFGQTLGFDMETMPTLNTLQMALLPDCCPDAEEELLSILTHLLVCAIEDPGIPHPGRHTTILGQTLRTNEVTPANLSEVLRIYLYANATGEVKALTGINPERDRERRLADHHQGDSEALEQSCHGRNAAYYTHLHACPTWRLADQLRRRPYTSLSPALKARILARLCDDLLQSKAVLRQIEGSLDNLSQLRKERYLMDAKLRKLKLMHSRKLRTETAEKQQALALERMQRLVEESEIAARGRTSAEKENLSLNPDSEMVDYESHDSPIQQKNSIEDGIENDHENIVDKGEDEKMNHSDAGDLDSGSMGAPALFSKESVKEKEVKEMCDMKATNGAAKDIITDKDSIMGDGEILSDVESEGTQPEEDEDKNLAAEELSRKLEKLMRQSDTQLQSLVTGAHALRATCYGQDRYWRRYWSLSKCGGVFVEGMESTQPEILQYQEHLEENANRKDGEDKRLSSARKHKRKGRLSDKSKSDSDSKSEDQLQSERELRNIKSELNLSDHTRIIKYEPGQGKVEGSPIKMEEKYIQQQKVAEDHLLDIEDSIPTAFLVQKPNSNKNIYGTLSAQAETDKNDAAPKTEPADIKSEQNDTNDAQVAMLEAAGAVKTENKDGIMGLNNLEELKKMAESVIQPKEEKEAPINNVEDQVKEEKVLSIKDETNDPATASAMLAVKMTEGKWFSILRKENGLAGGVSNSQQANGVDDKDSLKNLNLEGVSLTSSIPTFSDNTQSCSEIILTQGNKWDVCNNLHLLNNPSLLLFGNSSNQSSPPVVTNYYNADCTLTMSGLDQEAMDSSLNPKEELMDESLPDDSITENGTKEPSDNHIDNSTFHEQDMNNSEPMDASSGLAANNSTCDKSSTKSTASSTKPKAATNGNHIPHPVYNNANCQLGLAGMNLSTLTAYVSCDSPAPIQMTPEESQQLEQCKVSGLPKKLEGNYVPKDLRHGWWRITDTEQLREALSRLHPRGVREKELHNTFMAGLIHTNNKLQIEKGDQQATELSISHMDRVIALNGGFPMPDPPGSFSAKAARRVDMALLEQVEALEERVAAASMQMKGWKPPPRVVPEESAVLPARHRLLGLEAAIERRYLRPPLGAGAAPPTHEETPPPRPASPDADPRGPVVGIPRGLAMWREATARCQSSAQLAMVLHALESAIAWDKSIMKANCQFCLSGDSEDKLLLCDGCDKGYHTYCFKPKMDKIPDGDWYCFECLNKATGERVCIVCGGRPGSAGAGAGRGRLVPCALCPRAYHQDCHYPPLNKVPRGKWYCVNCISKAPPKKPRAKKPSGRNSSAANDGMSDTMQPPSPAPSQASTTTTIEDCPITSAMLSQSSLSSVQSTPEKHFQTGQTGQSFTDPKPFASINNLDSLNSLADKTSDANDMDYSSENDKDMPSMHRKDFMDTDDVNMDGSAAMMEGVESSFPEDGSDEFVGIKEEKRNSKTTNNIEDCIMRSADGDVSCGATENDSNSGHNSEDCSSKGSGRLGDKEGVSVEPPPSPPRDRKKERNSGKRLNKELSPCKALLEEMELHDDSWPFLLPVNTKQFPTYKKVIRAPMDLSTIKRKLQDYTYKTKEEFACDVRQIFHNCEVFNEDESPVGRAGHGMRRFFEDRWATLV